MSKNVLKGAEWHNYLKAHEVESKSIMQVYHSTYNYNQIYKLGEYYYCFAIARGYKNLASLKRLIKMYC